MKFQHKSFLILWFVIGLWLTGCAGASTPTLESDKPLPVTQQVIATSAVATVEKANRDDCNRIALVLTTEAASDIYTVCSDGSRLVNISDDPYPDSQPAWSPDGATIAFASLHNESSQIYIVDSKGGKPAQLTFDYSNDFPIWLPDGKRIAFRTTDRQGLWWWRILDRENNQISQYSEPSYDFFFQTPAWSPDGQYLAYMSLVEQKQRNDGASQIHVKRMDSTQDDIALTNDTWANISPTWSPDSSKIAFLSERDGNYNLFALYVINRDGTNIQQITQPIFSDRAILSWSPNAQQIAIDQDIPNGNIYLVDIQSGTMNKLLNLPGGERASAPAWQP